jgi:hypothetical protein
LIFGNKPPENGHTLADCGIQAKSTLRMVENFDGYVGHGVPHRNYSSNSISNNSSSSSSSSSNNNNCSNTDNTNCAGSGGGDDDAVANVQVSERNDKFIEAAGEGQVEACRLLLESKGDVECRDEKKQTPLIIAASKGHTETCRLLLACNADVNVAWKFQRTPLFFAAKGGFTSTCEYLCDFPACFIGAKDRNGRTAADWAARPADLDLRVFLVNAIALEKQEMVEWCAPKSNNRVFTNAILDFCIPHLEKDLAPNDDAAFMKARVKVSVQRSVGSLAEYVFDYETLTIAEGAAGKRVVHKLKAAATKAKDDNAALFAVLAVSSLTPSRSSTEASQALRWGQHPHPHLYPHLYPHPRPHLRPRRLCRDFKNKLFIIL